MQGRCYPVHVKYGQSFGTRRVEEAVNAAIRMHLHEGPGDILVFLTGSEECEQARKLCYQKLEELLRQGKPVPSMQIFALYGAQNAEDQVAVFEPTPEDSRKVPKNYIYKLSNSHFSWFSRRILLKLP